MKSFFLGAAGVTAAGTVEIVCIVQGARLYPAVL
jgi:hypothetical protein